MRVSEGRIEFQRVMGWLATERLVVSFGAVTPHQLRELEESYIRHMTEPEPNYRGPGVYLHYKGGKYQVLGLALQEDTVAKPEEPSPERGERVYVIYRPLSSGSLLEWRPEDFWAHELSDFNAVINDAANTNVPRFTVLHTNPTPVLDRELGTPEERAAYQTGYADCSYLIDSPIERR